MLYLNFKSVVARINREDNRTDIIKKNLALVDNFVSYQFVETLYCKLILKKRTIPRLVLFIITLPTDREHFKIIEKGQ